MGLLYYVGFAGRDEDCMDNMTLDELHAEVLAINEEQKVISSCGLSREVSSLALKELQGKKIKYLETIQRRVNELCMESGVVF